MRITFAKLIGMALGLFISVSLCAQVGINPNGAAPDASAMLDIASDTKGFLTPRMSAAERAVIAAPPTRLLG